MKNCLVIFLMFSSTIAFSQTQRSTQVKNQCAFENWFEPDTIKNFTIERCKCEKSIAKYHDELDQVWPVFLDLESDQIFYLSRRVIADRIVFDRINLN